MSNVPEPEADLPRGLTGGSDVWDQPQASVILAADYFDAAPGGGAPTPLVYGSYLWSGSISASSYTWTGMAVGAAASDRWVVAALQIHNSYGEYLSAVTIGGVSATLLYATPAAGPFQTRFEFWAANVPTGTTADVAVTCALGPMWDGGCATYYCAGEPTVYASVLDNTYTGNTFSVSIDVPEGGAIIAAASNDNDGTLSGWVGATADATDDTEQTYYASADELHAETGRTVSFTSTTPSTSDNYFGLAVLSLSIPAAGGGGTISGAGAAAGSATVSASGASTRASSGAINGAATAGASGAATKAAGGVSAGVGSASAVGGRILSSAATASGVGSASAGGAGIISVVGAAAGGATAAATGSTAGVIGSGAGAAAGGSVAQATGAAIGAGAGASAGVGAAVATGASTRASAGVGVGIATASATGAATRASFGICAGVAAASAVGQSTAASIGTATGSSAANGSSAAGTVVSGVGTSPGTSAVSGMATQIIARAVAAAGAAAAQAGGGQTIARGGAAFGGAFVSGIAAQIIARAVQVAGHATADAVGDFDFTPGQPGRIAYPSASTNGGALAASERGGRALNRANGGTLIEG